METPPNNTTEEKAPASFQELALRVSFAFWRDIHVNLSGIIYFAVLVYGVLNPDLKPQCQEISTLAAIYLFGAAKKKTP